MHLIAFVPTAFVNIYSGHNIILCPCVYFLLVIFLFCFLVFVGSQH